MHSPAKAALRTRPRNPRSFRQVAFFTGVPDIGGDARTETFPESAELGGPCYLMM